MDRAVVTEVMCVLEPAAFRVAAGAATQDDEHQDQALRATQLDLEAVRYAADRAWRQYDHVDPANRMVADEQERRWNEAMQQVHRIEERLNKQQALHEQGHVCPAQPETMDGLAEKFRRAWDDPRTNLQLKKLLLRALIDEIVVDDPNHRGQGIGRMLLEATLAALKVRGAPRVVLWAAAQDAAAQRLTEPELVEVFSRSDLDACRRSAYLVHVALDEIIEASFPNPGDKDRLRQMITDDIGVNALGINARREGGTVMYSFPIAIFVGCKK